ncbi:MAG: hypothetical protein ACI977_000055 [Candidatus Nanohaloarchaea archaeon]|jgi:hypothetical protein
MKFELFGRLGDNNGQQDQEEGGNNGFNAGFGEEDFQTGGDLDRTVQNMFDQGYSEDEIKSELQGQYAENEITQSINRVVTSSATGNNNSNDGPEPMTPYQGDEGAVSPMDEGYSQDKNENGGGNEMNNINQNTQNDNMMQEQQNPQQPQQPTQQSGRQGQGNYNASGNVDPAVEELIETIIAENFEKVEAEFHNVYDELDTFAEEIEDLKQRVHDLEVRDDEDQQQFVQKIDEVEEHIDEYESRIGGLEKAFQQVLPSLVDNVRELTDLVQELKDEGEVSEGDFEDMDVEDLQ